MKMARFEAMGSDIANLGATGNPDILFELGIMYSTGRTGEVDLVTAHKWFNIAAMKGSDAARHRRQEVAIQMSRQQIASAQKAAREWITLH
jgi:TPR repeat protein